MKSIKVFMALMFIFIVKGLVFTSTLDSMYGLWKGEGKIIVNWCNKRSLDISIQIHEDSTVKGKFGDAIIENGKIKRNSRILRLLGNSEYLISGKLHGAIIKEESISRKGLKYLSLTYDRGQLVGGFYTTGKSGLFDKAGRKNKMKFSGIHVLLNRLEE